MEKVGRWKIALNFNAKLQLKGSFMINGNWQT
jgi:hypothetical protein